MGVHRRRRDGAAALAGVAVAAVTAGVLIWNSSYAAFTASTSNSGNSWSTGTVTITNDHTAGAVFSVATVKPDTGTSTLAPPSSGAFVASSTSAGGSACFKVTYTGTMAADVRLWAAVTETGTDGGLGPYMLMSVDTGTDTAPGTDTSCATYTSSTSYVFGSANNTTVLASTLPANFGAATAGWNGATTNATKWYRVSWLLPLNVNTLAQAEQVQIAFTWEAQNT